MKNKIKRLIEKLFKYSWLTDISSDRLYYIIIWNIGFDNISKIIQEKCYNSKYDSYKSMDGLELSQIGDYLTDGDHYTTQTYNYDRFGDCNLASMFMFYGYGYKETNAHIQWLKNNKKFDGSPWSVTGIKVSVNQPEIAVRDNRNIKTIKQMGALFANNVGFKNFIKPRFIDQYHKYDNMNNKHLYLKEGFEMTQFDEAIENVEYLYQDYLDVTAEYDTAEEGESDY